MSVMANPRGSEWHRWDPHIHAPGTLLNDQFRGDWDAYLSQIENALPPVSALGITDYFCIHGYREVKRRRDEGRLANVGFILPNVELRLDIKTEQKRALNLHLLFCPDDPDHEEQIERILRRFTFEYRETTYACTPEDLARLGRVFSPGVTVDQAVRVGANQFKVTLHQLREVFRSESWLATNCLIAVPASSTDGTAGLQHDDSFTAVRREIERIAHIVFSAAPSDRAFWLGQKPGADQAFIEQTYRTLKPCLHGSDAHVETKVAKPDHDRYCWIKGDLTFEALRQAVIEPEDRVWIGPTAPPQPPPSTCIALVRTVDAPWIQSEDIPVNPGLVAVIGARGSGKTALVDIIAAGANAMTAEPADSSFLRRAMSPIDHVRDARVEIAWGDGSTSERPLKPAASEHLEWVSVDACYLSQHFVEQLCSSEGLATELRNEMERLVFEATDPTKRLEAENFGELATASLEPVRWRRQEIQDSIQTISDEIAREEVLRDSLPRKRQERETLAKQIEQDRKDLQLLVPKGKEDRAKKSIELERLCKAVEATVEGLRRRRKMLDDLSADVDHVRSSAEPKRLATLRQRFAALGLDSAEWDLFRMDFVADVEGYLNERKRLLDREIMLRTEGDPQSPVDATGEPTAVWPLRLLHERSEQLKKEVGIDVQQQAKFNALQRVVGEREVRLQRLDAEIKNAEGAEERRRHLITSRREQYARVFATLVEEEQVLKELYAPLGGSLQGQGGTLGRLEFVVQRSVDIAAWANRGEDLLDLRNSGAFRGQGALQAKAGEELLGAWRLGDANAVAAAMESFRDKYWRELVRGMPGAATPEERAQWIQSIGAWLYDTTHLSIEYGIHYDGVAIEQLSPGTRGIALLLLYLAVDHHDRRPLIIDQPEENLDPNSVFKELVPHFRAARKRRQVIIVTHNANLVVNTDVDQVIVATSVPNPFGGVPQISYRSGSLENPAIRRSVCDILEGGERAFLERERRYRLRWDEAVLGLSSESTG